MRKLGANLNEDRTSRVGIIIQARMNSSRFPGKSTALIHGSPLIEWVIQSCRNVANADLVALAIPDTPECDILEGIAVRMDVPVVRGSRDNVLSRYVKAGKKFSLDYIVRITGDDPCHWPPLIELAIDRCIHQNGNYFISSTSSLSLVDGAIFEIISFPLLQEMARLYGHERDAQEHVTSPLREKKLPINLITFELTDVPPQLLDDRMRICVDTFMDYISLINNWEWIDTETGRIADTFRILENARKQALQAECE